MTAPSGDRFGKFVRVEKLGAGGMGEVWKAWDTELSRWVALKFPRHTDEEEIARFRREAETAGRLNHPNIAAIFEAQDDFIAMQFVEGRTLGKLATPDLREIVRLVRDAARALEYAHEQGVIHRDLKPDNLMVSGGQVYVMDFGLAQAVRSDSKLTLSGFVVGTPAYMPPEQARGAPADARSDVYGLGATLYELVTGRAPFSAANVIEVLFKVVEEEPKRPGGDPELETIILKCLEKSPERRYPTAGGLADDLERWLAGDAISARAPSVAYRLRKMASRRRGVLAVATIGACLAGGVWAWLELTVSRAEGRYTATQRAALDRMRQATDTLLEAALEMRRQDRAAEAKSYLATVKEACAAVIRELPAVAEPHYRLGRMHRALMEDAEALSQQEEALRKQPEYQQARYERAVLTARRYWDRVSELQVLERQAMGKELAREGLESGSARSERPWAVLAEADAEARRLRGTMEEDLKQLEGSTAVSKAQLECARGLLAWTEGRVDEARRCIGDALKRDGRLDEGYEALGMLEAGRGDYPRSIEWWTTGIEQDRGFVVLWEGRADARVCWALVKAGRGEDPLELYGQAVADFSEALTRHPGRDEAWTKRGSVHMSLGNHRASKGQDPTECYRQAIADHREALARNPARDQTWAWRGLAHGGWGLYTAGRGGDPTSHYRDAIADYGEALARNPARDDAWKGRGGVHAVLGDWSAGRGEDAGGHYRSAIADLGEALARNPADDQTWMWRGSVRMRWGVHRESRGLDPTDLYRAAIEDYGEAISRNRVASASWRGRGSVRVSWGLYQAGRGEDPSVHYREAVADYGESIARNPAVADAWKGRGTARMNWGAHVSARGEDPSKHYQEALADYGEALARNPARDDAWSGRALVRVNWALHAVRRGQDPSEHYRAAIADFGEALARNPARDETWCGRGLARLNGGIYRKGRGEDPSAYYREAVADFDEALARNPARDETWSARGLARANWGLYKNGRGQDPSELYRQAIADYGEALARNRASTETWMRRSAVRTNLGNFVGRRENPSEHYRAAIEDAGEALKINERNAAAWEWRGNALANWGSHKRLHGDGGEAEIRSAIASFETALKHNPEMERVLRPRIETCRKVLGE